MRKREGMTFIEVLIGMILLAMIAVSILPMSIYATRFSKWNNIKQNSLSLAYSQIEWLKTLDYVTELELKDIEIKYRDSKNIEKITKGIVEERLFMNEEGTNPIIIDGVEYKILTGIYWESGETVSGENIYNALRKVDVTVTAREQFSGEQKVYSVLGTLIAFEGERAINMGKELIVTAYQNGVRTKNIKVNLYNRNSNNAFKWGRTDEKGEIFFVELSNGDYKIDASEGLMGNMITKPERIEGTNNNKKWSPFIDIKINNNTVQKDLYVDFPGKIYLANISDDIKNNATFDIKPNVPVPEGVANDYWELSNKFLRDITTFQFWREWEYDNSINYDENQYYFVNSDTLELWDGKFEIKNNKPTDYEFTLGYKLGQEYTADNKYEIKDSEIDLYLSFPKSLTSPTISDMNFALIENDIVIYEKNEEDNITIAKENSTKNIYKITIPNNFDELILDGNITFVLKESVMDSNSIGTVMDYNTIELSKKDKNGMGL